MIEDRSRWSGPHHVRQRIAATSCRALEPLGLADPRPSAGAALDPLQVHAFRCGTITVLHDRKQVDGTVEATSGTRRRAHGRPRPS
jgi:hypothetical protein